MESLPQFGSVVVRPHQLEGFVKRAGYYFANTNLLVVSESEIES
jgi:hypothetical protein